MCPSKCGHAK
uniref:Uncharacterized protein n=1 Tax=Anguilla anguilla TaxID=7936 RepID=A0A0E9TT15_ANGAN